MSNGLGKDDCAVLVVHEPIPSTKFKMGIAGKSIQADWLWYLVHVNAL